jgi:hypothetical protein
MESTLDKFNRWGEYNHTHLTRFERVLARQILNQRAYIDLFSKYPANSIEFRVEAKKLYLEYADLLDEFKESMYDFINDGDLFKDVLISFEKEYIDKLPEND